MRCWVAGVRDTDVLFGQGEEDARSGRSPAAAAIPTASAGKYAIVEAVVSSVSAQMDEDRKTTALKSLQAGSRMSAGAVRSFVAGHHMISHTAENALEVGSQLGVLPCRRGTSGTRALPEASSRRSCSGTCRAAWRAGAMRASKPTSTAAAAGARSATFSATPPLGTCGRTSAASSTPKSAPRSAAPEEEANQGCGYSHFQHVRLTCCVHMSAGRTQQLQGDCAIPGCG